ncbi:MAG: glycosyltransferase family 2 protein [Candidatus Yanofskybacteria bacterium]|nr:glycosyltransferase family 2 protein [Candidatus Yanofskybacteria bacterium]
MKSQSITELSIIIVHHQTPELLKLCLKSLGKVLISGHHKSDGIENVNKSNFEIIVVDSTISRQARDLIREQYPEIKYIPFKENLGYARGVNIGIQSSCGKYILILNPDVIVTDGAIEKMADYMEKHPDIGILGPKVLNFNGTHQRTFFSYYKPATIIARRSFLGKFGRFKKELDKFLMADADSRKIQTPDWLMGSAIMVSREAFNKIGGMDERFFMYFEDVDWARRFWHNDYKVVYYPEAVIYHYHQRESSSRMGLLDAVFNNKTRWHIASAIKFFWKYRNLQKIPIAK